MPRENSKCRKWEKERRDRLKEGFTNLAKALPCYDPSVNICKIDVLHKAANSIQELQDRIKHLLSSDTENKTEKELIKKLQDRVKKLLVRNEQLSNLLRDAGITVPSVCGTIKRFKKQPLWSKRISPEQAELRKNEMEKENMVSVQHRNEKPKTTIGASTLKDQPVTNSASRKNRSRKNRNKRGASAANCYIVLSQPVPFRNNSTQHYYLITNQPSGNVRNTVKSGGLISGSTSKSVLVKTKPRPHKTAIHPTSSLSSLGPGTLILGNGVTLPVLSQPQTLLPNSASLIFNPTLYSVPKVVQTHETSSDNKNIQLKNSLQTTANTSTKTLPFIKPKYCLTKTTQVNKVPIPALTSRYATSYYTSLFSESKMETGNKKDLVRTKKTDLMKNETKKTNKRKNDDQEQIDNKRSKNDRENEVSVTKTSESSTLTVASVYISDISVIQENTMEVTTANTLSSESVEKEVNIVTNEQANCKIDKNSEIIQSENTEMEQIAPIDISEKIQEVVINKEDENPQISEMPTITSSSVTTTTVTAAAHDDMKSLEINLPHSELSNDIFASLQVPSGCQNPESTSPTAAFLLAFPLVSSGVKVTEVIDGENSESQSVTPTLLQIGTMDTTKSTQSQPDVITSNFLNLDSFSFFSSKDICAGFDNNYSTTVHNCKSQATTSVNTSSKATTSNTPVYVNVKSPSVPTCVGAPVKQISNIFCKTSGDTPKDIGKNMKNCEKPNESQKFTENTIYNSQVQANAKPDINFTLPRVSDTGLLKNLDQKSQCHTSTTYPNSTCDFSYRCDFTKTCIASTCSYSNVNRNYTNPLYTNCNNYNYNYHPDTNFNQNYYKNIPRNETKAYYPINYDSYPDYRKNDSTSFTGKYDATKYDSSTYMKEKKNSSISKVKTATDGIKQPINWMTAPDNRLQTSECLLTPFSKGNFSQTYPFTSYVTSSSTYFSTNTMDTNKMNSAASLNSHQRLDMEEKQFSWSPTKLPHFLDPPHTFVTSTLPTLVGDLALGNTLPFTEQKNDYKPIKENKDFRQISKVNNYENQSNFLSVSQLVDHNKPESIAAKTTSRRNSGNRSKNNVQQKTKRVTKHDNKEMMAHCAVNTDSMHQSRSTNNYNTFSSIDLFTEQKNKIPHKNSSSSYSAEALIGNQVPDETINKRYPSASNKSLGTSSFLAENIISYFPPVDLPQENYMSQNQNYQSNNFTHNYTTSLQNNTYPSNSFIYTASTIPSSYLGTNNFDPPGPQDYLSDGINLISNASKDNKQFNMKNCSKQLTKEDKSNHHSICSNNMKKPKKKPLNDANNALFDFPFLPIPGTNNSPILPDDFHAHTNFLAPTTPFSCKNSLYPKQSNDISGTSLLPLPSVCRSTIQHPEISPINAVGPSLTNFNLSTIFPEINKGPISDMYQDTRVKDHLHHKSYSSTTPQVPFNTEPKFNFST